MWLDGSPVSDLNTTQSLGSNPIGRVQTGNNQTGRTYDVALDDVAVSRPISGYPRPKGASPTDLPLVPALRGCASPNAAHGAPLADSSCSPPAPELRLPHGRNPRCERARGPIGRAAARGRRREPRQPRQRRPGRPPDHAQLTDVRKKGDLSDYGGEFQVTSAIRITDRHNGPFADEPATASDLPFNS